MRHIGKLYADSFFVLGGNNSAHDTVVMGVWTQDLDAEFETVLERCRAVLGAFAEAVELGRSSRRLNTLLHPL